VHPNRQDLDQPRRRYLTEPRSASIILGSTE
jgi:hypothetical protein